MKSLKLLLFAIAKPSRLNVLCVLRCAILMVFLMGVALPGLAQNTKPQPKKVPTLEELLAASPNAKKIRVGDQILPADKLRAFLKVKGGSRSQSSSLHNWAVPWPNGKVAYTNDSDRFSVE